jgi:phospholipid/cholesterol/gamma-HCH transport system substrate-binding protein
MNNKRRFEWKVGLFVFIGLVVLGVLLLQFSKGTALFRPTYNLYLTAKNVGGLKVRASVLMAGVQIGTVSDIRLNPSGTNVTITLRLYRPYGIHKDARFLIEQSGFLGDQFVAVMPVNNEGPVFVPDEHAQAQEPFNLQEVARSASGFIQRIDETAQRINDAIGDVRRLVLNEQTLTNLSTTVGTMRVASERALLAVDHVNTLLDTNGPSVAAAVSNLVFFSEQINQFGDKFGDVLSTNSTEITVAVKNIESSTVVLKSLLTDLQSGKGLAGKVLRNEELAMDFQRITDNLTITTSNLNRLGLWGILWSHKPPRTNAPAEKTLEAPKTRFD